MEKKIISNHVFVLIFFLISSYFYADVLFAQTDGKILTSREIAQKTLPSTVRILVSDSKTNKIYSGSGFFITKDILVTNYHVVKSGELGIAKIVGKDESYKIMRIMAFDEINDLALLRIDSNDGSPLILGKNDSVAIGDEIFAVGNPMGFEGTFSPGIISGIRKTQNINLLQITAPLSEGSSGGPIVNKKGEVIGIAVASIKEGQSLNFAVPVSTLQLLVTKAGIKLIGIQDDTMIGFSFQTHRLVRESINLYKGSEHRAMEVGLYRSGFFMTMARRIFREEGVPENITWTGQVISSWTPNNKGGIWGFTSDTSSRYGLVQNEFIDEKHSFEKATRAAARYFKFLSLRYEGNWELAIAAYYAGEVAVDEAVSKSDKKNLWTLKSELLPPNTINFVSKVLATIIIAKNPQTYGFGHVVPAPRLSYDRIRLPSSTSLVLIAQGADTSVQYLRYLNPELLTNTTPPEVYIVRVPFGKANDLVALFRKDNNKETWERISRRTGVSVEDLMRANPGMKIPRGKVFIPYTTSEPKPTGKPVTNEGVKTFESEYVGERRNPSIQVINKSDRTLNLKFGGVIYAINAGESKSIVVEEGNYEYYATARNAFPTSGVEKFSKGYKYSWTFYIVREKSK